MRRSHRPYLILPLIALVEAGLFVYDWHILPTDGANWVGPQESVTIQYVSPGSPAEEAGLLMGDQVISVNGIPAVWYWTGHTLFHSFHAGERVRYEIIRNAHSLSLSVMLVSVWSMGAFLFPAVFGAIILILSTGLFILRKKPGDVAARLFFALTCIIAIIANVNLVGGGTFAIPRGIILSMAFPFLGITLLHFSLAFPYHLKALSGFRWIVKPLYGFTALVGMLVALMFVRLEQNWDASSNAAFELAMKLGHAWVIPLVISSIIVIGWRFVREPEFISKNQIRWLLTGFSLSVIPFMMIGFGVSGLFSAIAYDPVILQGIFALGALLLVASVAMAIFRFRLWEIELIIRRGVLYGGVILAMVCSYMFFIYLIDLFFDNPTRMIRISAVALSALLLILLRETVMRRVDRLFNREGYNVSDIFYDFDSKLMGIYDKSDLYKALTSFVNEIFHFKSFVLVRRQADHYVPVGTVGDAAMNFREPLELPPEILERLKRKKPSGLREFSSIPDYLDRSRMELIVPMYSDDRCAGFFLCGQKVSEKAYTAQDVQTLTVLAQRSATLFHVADLYERELERQLAMERERVRISEDLHDDVGASLSRITMLSEVAYRDLKKTQSALPEGSDGNIGKLSGLLNEIARNSREILESMSDVVWSADPRHDSFEDLSLRMKNYTMNLLSVRNIPYEMSFPDELMAKYLPIEFKRNLYLIYKEALNNVIRHSAATCVKIAMEYEDGVVRLRIQDNGTGFDPGTRRVGNGLRNMRRRADSMKGRLEILPAREGGTAVNFQAELP